MRGWSRLVDWRAWELPAKLAVDAAIVFVSFLAALVLRFEGDIPPESLDRFLSAYPPIALVYLTVNVLFGLYRRWWRYAGLHDAISLAQSVGLSTFFLFALDLLLFPVRDFPLGVVLIGGGITLLTMGLAKLRPRLRRRFLFPWLGPTGSARMLIVGAGRSGQMLARELVQHREWQYKPVCFVDDDPKKHGLRIHGVPVRGNRLRIPELVARLRIDVIAIAVPSATGPEVRDLVTICHATAAKIQIMPGIPEMIAGQAGHAVLRELTVTDLLGRQTVEIDVQRCRRGIAGKVVLVTGAAGSIGAELCRQLIALEPAKLLAADNNESGLYDLAVGVASSAPEGTFKPCLVDVADAAKVDRLFAAHRPRVVFHAAAFKHVPLMEEHVSEAFAVNVLGTLNVCLAAERFAAERLAFVSSDKAVKPSSVMGATKRIGELLVAELGRRSATSFCAVRFGNVLGSRGSVVPTFLRQIESGGPVSVTHPDVSRFFMTVAEAGSLVVQAATFARSGEIFVLDMGEEIKIVDLAHKMIRLKGLRPGRDVAIVFSGLRPGEKLREALVDDDEELQPTDHPKVRRVLSRRDAGVSSLLVRVPQLALQTSPVTRSALFDLLATELAAAGAAPPGTPPNGPQTRAPRAANY